jgi:ribonuclease T2
MPFRLTAVSSLLAAAALAWPGPVLSEQRPRDGTPGDFDYYALVLSWSPTHCSEAEGADDGLQCNRRDGRRYGFVLHGLWPQYERGYPESCRSPGRPFVPELLIERMLDIMPSRSLIIHEYRKHGTCSGLKPDEYFETSRKMFSSIAIPPRYINPFESQFVRPADLIDELLEENPDLTEDMIAVSCRGSGNRLRELRICFSKDGKPQACGKNESQPSLCSAREMFVPPVRSSKIEPDSPEQRKKALPGSPLPAPRVIPSLR